jgi:hypothetical protein
LHPRSNLFAGHPEAIGCTDASFCSADKTLLKPVA